VVAHQAGWATDERVGIKTPTLCTTSSKPFEQVSVAVADAVVQLRSVASVGHTRQ
jgi:hypothetical protein